jgi:hypothetical protein
MAAFNDTFLNERDNQYRTDEINYGRFQSVATPDPDDEDESDDVDTDVDLDEDDTEFDDEDLDDVDLDEDDLIDDKSDYGRVAAVTNSDENTDEPEPDFHPNETPEEEGASKEDARYPDEEPTRPDQSESDASYSEQEDVTPPTPHEFPSVGHAKTDFESRPHGRTTGRMTGHEPGTEGI